MTNDASPQRRPAPRKMVLFGRVGPVLITLFAVLVPVIVILAMVWVRQNLYDLNPADFDASSPTISRAISEPAVATGFALIITFTCLLLAFVIWQVVRLYLATIRIAFHDDATLRRKAMRILAASVAAQACGIAGMIMLSWMTLRFYHIGGSYLFFAGQSVAIFFSGSLCRMLVRSPSFDPSTSAAMLSPRMSALRSRASLCIAVATLVFWALFLVRDDMSEVPFWINKSFSTLEILLIVSFLLYLSTFSFELYRSRLVHAERPEADRAQYAEKA